jgi:hypothetical protein
MAVFQIRSLRYGRYVITFSVLEQF